MKAGQADAGESGLFPRLDIWALGGEERQSAAYGPNATAVAAVLEQALGLDWLGIERVGSVWDYGNDGSRDQDRNTATVKAAVTAAAEVLGLHDSVRAAFLDGQLAVLLACNPPYPAWEYWWNSYPEVAATFATGYLAAATVVQDQLLPSDLDLVRRPFDALDHGLPAGVFGPNHDAAVAIIEAVSGLQTTQADRVAAVWARKPDGDLTNFGFPSALRPELGRDGWMPERKGRRHHAWIELMLLAGKKEMKARRFEWATNSAWMRLPRLPGSRELALSLHGAIEAAVAAAVFADLAPAELLAELDEAWRSRDHAVEPSLWWERKGERAAARAARRARFQRGFLSLFPGASDALRRRR